MTTSAQKPIIDKLANELFAAQFIDIRFIKQLTDEGLLAQLYPGGIPSR